MTEEERRRLIEERRKREMTSDDFQRHIQATLQARAAGRPDPAPVTESGELIRPYVDPRDEMIASSPALVRPVYSILDRMLRPGRAGMADRMNREYMEGLLKRDADQRRGLAERQLIEAQGQKMQADAVVAGLQRTVAEGNEQERKAAADRLREIGVATGRVTPQGTDFSQLFETGGSRFTPSGEEVIPKAAGTAPAATSPALTDVSNMTPTEFRENAASMEADIDSKIAEQQSIIDTGMLPEQTVAGPGAYSAGYQYVPPVKVRDEATYGQVEAAKVRLRELQAAKQQLQRDIERFIDKPSATVASPAIVR
jgi:hypothetical protein